MSTVEQLYQKMYECYDEICDLKSKLLFNSKLKFKLIDETKNYNFYAQNKKFIFETENFNCDPFVTFKEIFITAKPHFHPI